MKRLLLILPLATLLLGAKGKKSGGEEVPGAWASSEPAAATVNGTPIPADLVRSVAGEDAGDPDAEAEALGQIIQVEVLYQEALARKLHREEAVRRRLALGARETLAVAALEALVEERITPAALKESWEAEPYFHQPQVKASHILLKDEAAAQAALARARAGEDFAALARALSEDPGSAQDGGALGWFGRDEMVEEFEAAAFGGEVGEVVGPFASRFGWHVLKVEGRRDEVPLEEVRGELAARMRSNLAPEVMRELTAKAKVERADRPLGARTRAVGAIPVLPTDLVVGRADARFTVVMFSDLQCPFCATAWAAAEPWARATRDVRLVYKHWPIDGGCNPNVDGARHPQACAAALAVSCAGDDAASLVGALLGNHAGLTAAGIRAHALAAGVDATAYDACVADPATLARVRVEIAQGDAVQVAGTPSFYVGDGASWVAVTGGVEEVRALVDALRAGATLPR